MDWSDSAPDGGSSSSSDFEPDADHVSEDEVDAGEHEDLDADDLDIGVTPSDSGYRETCILGIGKAMPLAKKKPALEQGTL